MRLEMHIGAAAGEACELSFAAREQRSRRELLALRLVVLGLAVLAAVAMAALSLGGYDSGAVAQPTLLVPSDRESAAPAPLESVARRPAAVAPRSAALAAHETLEPAAPARPARASRKESEFLAEFRALLDEASFLAAVEDALKSDRPAAQSMAALLASYERLGERSVEHFTLAARELTVSTPGAESVARAGIDWLGRRAQREVAARAVLERVATHGQIEPALRAASGFTLVCAAPLHDLGRLESLLLRDPDEHVRQSVESGLDARRRAGHDAAPARDDS